MWFQYLFLGTSLALAAEDPSTLQCSLVMRSIGSSCSGDAEVRAAVNSNCKAISDEEKKYIAQVLKCANTGNAVNKKGSAGARDGQAQVTSDTSQLLEKNRSLLDDCGAEMGKIATEFEKISKELEPKVENPGGSEKCQPKAKRVFEQLKERADAGAAKAKSKAGEYGNAEKVVAMKRDVTKDNADKLGGGDSGKADDSKGGSGGGGGGGMPDPSSLMKAMSDQKAKKDAEEAKAEAARKAQEAKEKAMRVQQCQNNEINRNNAISKCKADFPVDPRYAVVQSVKKDQEDCLSNVAATHGTVVSNCNAAY